MTCYRSSPFLILRSFLCALILPVGAALLIALVLLDIQSEAAIYAILAGVALLCLAYTLRGGYARVTVADDEIIIGVFGRGETRVPRSGFNFSSSVVSHSVNLIPVQTERSLIAYNDRETLSILLPNISKGSFDLLMASLRRAKPGAMEGAPPKSGMTFALPKEEMLREFRRMMAFLGVGGAALWLVVVGYVTFKVSSAPPELREKFSFMLLAGMSALMIFGFGIPVFWEYLKRKRDIPENISLDGERLAIGEESYRLADIRRITATPPEYGQGNFSLYRKLTVQTEWERKTYNMGVRKPGGAWKTMFADYAPLCEKLETAAGTYGYDFIYDL